MDEENRAGAPFCYLDHAATSPLRPEVEETVLRVFREEWGNPSSLHSLGARARRVLEEARAFLQGTLGASRVIFTSGATEANNLAVRGRIQGKRPCRVLALATEHSSVLETLKAMEKEGHRVTLLPVDREGVLRMEELENALGPSVRLLCLLGANNETGTIQPLEKVVPLAREKAPNAWIHVDWVQGYGRSRFDLDSLDVDSASISGHKLGAPQGIGALALRKRDGLQPCLTGGGQEEGARAGTENLPGAAGLAKAAEKAFENAREEWERLEALRRDLLSGLEDRAGETRLNGPREGGLPHILNVSFPGVPGEVLLHHLEKENVYVGTGAACSGKRKGGSHVLAAMGTPPWAAASALRFSLGYTTTPAEIDRILEVLPPILERLRGPGRKG